MTSPTGLLDFFILEAAEYVERLDGFVAAAQGGPPDAAAFTQQARALRGSATMAKMKGIADVAAGTERVGRALVEGRLPWDAALRGTVVAAVDDLKLLLRAARTWGVNEDERARVRCAELTRIAPVTTGSMTPVASSASNGSFLASETSQLASGLDLLFARPDALGASAPLLARVRALRGVAAIKDVPPLPDVVDALEHALKPIELGATSLSAEQTTLLESARSLLRRMTAELSGGARPAFDGDDVRRFADAVVALHERGGESDQIVPVGSLFFDDAGPHVVYAAPNPPTTPAERFRMEAVSQAEHLRRLVADARQARDSAARGRLGRELRLAVRALGAAAQGFGERTVATFATRFAERAASLEAASLGALDEVAALLSDAQGDPDRLVRRLVELTQPVSAAPTAPAASREPRDRSMTPTGKDLHAMLQHGITGISMLEQQPLSEPAYVGEEPAVPIEQLLYRGRAALGRAREVRDDIRRRGGAPDESALGELFDLLDLAVAE